MSNRSNEPFLWMLFSAGGVVAALLLPIQLFLFGLAFPLGWLGEPSYQSLLGLVRHPITRLYLLVLCTLPLFHWAHRFRFTLYDGLQIKHLNELINTFCYGGAVLGTLLAAYLLWNIPQLQYSSLKVLVCWGTRGLSRVCSG
jgi:fumarate reductase subunit D